jgi:hypothetical protein
VLDPMHSCGLLERRGAVSRDNHRVSPDTKAQVCILDFYNEIVGLNQKYLARER